MIRQEPNAQGKALSVVSRGEHLKRAFLTDRVAPDTIVVTAGNERGASVWSTAVLTTSRPLHNAMHDRFEEALGPAVEADWKDGSILAWREVPAPGEYNHFLSRIEGGSHLVIGDAASSKPLLDYLADFATGYGPPMDEVITPVKTLRAKPITPPPGSSGGIVSALGRD